jgi:hypothetical protein
MNGRKISNISIAELLDLLQDRESLKLSLKSDNPFIYPKSKRANAVFLRFNAVCNDCINESGPKTENGKYTKQTRRTK